MVNNYRCIPKEAKRLGNCTFLLANTLLYVRHDALSTLQTAMIHKEEVRTNLWIITALGRDVMSNLNTFSEYWLLVISSPSVRYIFHVFVVV